MLIPAFDSRDASGPDDRSFSKIDPPPVGVFVCAAPVVNSGVGGVDDVVGLPGDQPSVAEYRACADEAQTRAAKKIAESFMTTDEREGMLDM